MLQLLNLSPFSQWLICYLSLSIAWVGVGVVLFINLCKFVILDPLLGNAQFPFLYQLV
jgi:hypothetical protein